MLGFLEFPQDGFEGEVDEREVFDGSPGMGAEFPDFGQKIGNGQGIGGGLPHAGVGS